MSNQNLEQENWLIRSKDNIVSGPFGKKQILQMIKAGELKGKTELAPANSFWFYCDEKQLLEQYFPELAPGTATNLKNLTEKTKTLNQPLPLDGEITSSKIELEKTQTGISMEKTQTGISMETTTASKEDLDLLKKLQEARPMPRIRRPDELNKQAAALKEANTTKISVEKPKSAFSQSPKLYAAIAVAVFSLMSCFASVALRIVTNRIRQKNYNKHK